MAARKIPPRTAEANNHVRRLVEKENRGNHNEGLGFTDDHVIGVNIRLIVVVLKGQQQRHQHYAGKKRHKNDAEISADKHGRHRVSFDRSVDLIAFGAVQKY